MREKDHGKDGGRDRRLDRVVVIVVVVNVVVRKVGVRPMPTKFAIRMETLLASRP